MLAKNSSKWKPSGWDKYTKIKHKWKLKANVFSAMFCLKTAATALGFHPRAPDGDVRGCLQPKYCTLSSFFKGTPLQSRGSWESEARATARHFHCKSQVFWSGIIAIAVLWSWRQTSVAWTMLSYKWVRETDPRDSQRPFELPNQDWLWEEENSNRTAHLASRKRPREKLLRVAFILQ